MVNSAVEIPDEYVSQLRQVYWIGGPPDSGKTTVAEIIAARHSFKIYHFDRHEMEHFGRADPELTPALWAAHPDRMNTEQRWLGTTPEEMARETIRSWSERCQMAFDDIRRLTAKGPVVAEGPGFFPELIAPVLTGAHRAIWLIPTEEFKRRSVAWRGKPGTKHETSDPELASTNLIARDQIMSQHIQEQCQKARLSFILVTGEESAQSITTEVERHFRL